MNGKALSFYINDKMFGLDIRLVKEISRRFEFSHVPDANPNIVGLMNLRGQVVTLFNISRILGLDQPIHEKEQVEERNTACIILKAHPNNPNQIGFLIDRSGDVLDIQHEWCEKTPANVEEVNTEYIREVVKLTDELLLMLDTDKVFDL